MADHYVSYSSLGLHRACPQRYKYAYLDLLTQAQKEASEVARDLGSWWHMVRAADSIERGHALRSLRWLPEALSGPDSRKLEVGPLEAPTATVQGVYELVSDWWERMPLDWQDVWVSTLGEPALDRLRYLNDRWHEAWATEIATEVPLAVELKWRRDLPGAPQLDGTVIEHGTVAGGYIDEVYLDRKRGMVTARDYKLPGKLGTQTVYDDMVDSQLQLYVWGGSPLVSEWGLGPIRCIAYDRACASKPTSPQVTVSGLLSKSITMYDLTTYLEWAKGPDGLGVPWGKEDEFFVSGPRKGLPKFGRYVAEDSVIAHLSTPAWKSTWHQRTLTPLNRNMIKTHLRSAVDSAVQIQATNLRVTATGEAQRNFSRLCNWCEYSGLCRTEMVAGPGGDYELEDFGLRKKDARDKR